MPDNAESAPKLPTLKQVTEKVIEIARRRPDFIYQLAERVDDEPVSHQCQYAHRDEDGELVPGCLYGHAFHELGIDLSQVSEFQEVSVVLVELEIIPEDWTSNRDMRKLVNAHDQTQSKQDAEATWGDAIVPLTLYLDKHSL